MQTKELATVNIKELIKKYIEAELMVVENWGSGDTSIIDERFNSAFYKEKEKVWKGGEL